MFSNTRMLQWARGQLISFENRTRGNAKMKTSKGDIKTYSKVMKLHTNKLDWQEVAAYPHLGD